MKRQKFTGSRKHLLLRVSLPAMTGKHKGEGALEIFVFSFFGSNQAAALHFIMEVDTWVNITGEFLHLTSRREPTEQATAELRPQLLAVLVAEATNLGLATMAHASGIPLHKLEQVYDWYFREETLRAAIDKVIGYHRALPLTLKFGDGTTSSSDGIRFGMAASSLNARHLPRYFGVRRGVTLYNHTTNQGNQPWIDVVNCLVRESTYVLDGLLYQDAPAIKEHYTDTGGFTELMFGLFSVLGFRFAPRQRDLSDQTLYRARKGADYGVLAPVLKKDVRDALIVAHWDEPLSAGSIAQRWPSSPVARGV